MVHSLWKIVWRFLRKLKIELPCDAAILLLGIYLTKIIIQKYACTLKFIAALFTTAKTRKQPEHPTAEEWIKKVWSVSQSVAQSCPTLQPREPQHARLPCPLPTPGVHPNPCPLSR